MCICIYIYIYVYIYTRLPFNKGELFNVFGPHTRQNFQIDEDYINIPSFTEKMPGNVGLADLCGVL